MDLFDMKRYWSEDGYVRQYEHQESDILNRLKDKALGKCSRSEAEKLDRTTSSVGGGVKNGSSARKKKRKRSADDLEAAGKSGFTVLGEDLGQSRNKVRRVLPHWLANPDVVSVDLHDNQMAITALVGLDEITITNLKANNISHFFPVQRQLIPHMLRNETNSLHRPNDICVSAPTGSGKTISFVVPIVQALRGRIVPKIRGLVVLPVQDLAAQVCKVFQQFCEGTDLKVKLLSGRKPFHQEQKDLVRPDTLGGFHSLADVVVATPGRLVDHIQKTAGFSLRALRFLVVDEADRVMEDVQNDWLSHVENAVFSGDRTRPGPLTVASAKKRQLPLQKLLFSATLSQNPEKLEQMNLFEPKLFTSVVQPKDICANVGRNEFVGKYTIPTELSELVVKVKEPLHKPMVLEALISNKKMKKSLIFTQSTKNSHALTVLLRQYGYKVDELSSKVRNKRSKILNRFNRGQIDLLVCTDALARGMDIGEIDYVVSYDCPRYVKTYIHRVGRTARAGRKGTAITLTARSDERKFQRMMREAGKEEKVDEEVVEEENLDSAAYERAREKAALALRAENEEIARKRRPGSTAKGNK